MVRCEQLVCKEGLAHRARVWRRHQRIHEIGVAEEYLRGTRKVLQLARSLVNADEKLRALQGRQQPTLLAKYRRKPVGTKEINLSDASSNILISF